MCLPAFMTGRNVTSVKLVIIFLTLLMLIEIPRNMVEIIWGTSSYVWTTAYLPPTSVPYYAVLSTGQQAGTAQYGWAYFMIALNPARGVFFILAISLALIAKERALPTKIAAAFVFIFAGFALFQIGYYCFFGWLDPYSNFISRTRDLTAVCNAQTCPTSLQFNIVFWTSLVYFLECFLSFGGLIAFRPSMQKMMIAMGDEGIRPISSLATTKNGHIIYKVDHHKPHDLSGPTVSAIMGRLKRHTKRMKNKYTPMMVDHDNNSLKGSKINKDVSEKTFVPALPVDPTTAATATTTTVQQQQQQQSISSSMSTMMMRNMRLEEDGDDNDNDDEDIIGNGIRRNRDFRIMFDEDGDEDEASDENDNDNSPGDDEIKSNNSNNESDPSYDGDDDDNMEADDLGLTGSKKNRMLEGDEDDETDDEGIEDDDSRENVEHNWVRDAASKHNIEDEKKRMKERKRAGEERFEFVYNPSPKHQQTQKTEENTDEENIAPMKKYRGEWGEPYNIRWPREEHILRRKKQGHPKSVELNDDM